jgi:hypothetical protein
VFWYPTANVKQKNIFGKKIPPENKTESNKYFVLIFLGNRRFCCKK